MARKVRDTRLETRTARLKLGSGLTYKNVAPGLAVGYRRGKRGGRWVARFYDGERRYNVEVIGHADDLVDADGVKILDFWQAVDKARDMAGKRTTSTVPASGPYRVEDAVADYLAYMESHKKTAREVRYRMQAHVLPVFGKSRVAALAQTEIERWHRELAEQPARLRSAKGKASKHRAFDPADAETRRKRQLSANRVLSQFKAALNRAFRSQRVASDVAWRLVQPFSAVDVPRTRYLSVAEAKRLANACEADFRLLVQAALLTGARYGELAALDVSDFNPDAGTLRIRTSKSGHARHIVLSTEGREFFKRIAAGLLGSEPMLRNGTRMSQRREGEDDGRWRKSEQLRPMRDASKRAKIDPPLGFHQLRHTWASLSVMGGMPLMVVARNLGHSDTRMVEKHYGHLSDSYVAKLTRDHAPRFGIKVPSKVEPIGRRAS